MKKKNGSFKKDGNQIQKKRMWDVVHKREDAAIQNVYNTLLSVSCAN